MALPPILSLPSLTLLGSLNKGSLSGLLKTNAVGLATGANLAFNSEIDVTTFLAMTDPLLNFQWAARVLNMNVKGEYISSISTPGMRYDTKSIYREGKMHHYASFFDTDTIRMTVYADTTNTSNNFALNWMRSVKSHQGFYRLPKDYKRDVEIVLTDSFFMKVFRITAVGCWPTAWESYDLSSEGSSAIATTLTLNVDDVKFETDTRSLAAVSDNNTPIEVNPYDAFRIA